MKLYTRLEKECRKCFNNSKNAYSAVYIICWPYNFNCKLPLIVAPYYYTVLRIPERPVRLYVRIRFNVYCHSRHERHSMIQSFMWKYYQIKCSMYLFLKIFKKYKLCRARWKNLKCRI